MSPYLDYQVKMVFIKNVNLTLSFSQGIFIIFGIWAPHNLNNITRYFYLFYSVVSLFLYIGVYIIVQFGDLIQVWGNLPLMAASLFLLFTNVVLGIKVINVIVNRKVIEDMLSESNEELTNENRKKGIVFVKRSCKDTTRLLIGYFSLALLSVFGLMSSAEKNELPLRAWYPYNISKTPAYQLTYAHQIIALTIAAAINVAFDTLVTSLIAQFRCRLSLVALSLRTLCEGLHVNNRGLLTQFSEIIITDRLQNCVVRHQAVLEQVKILKKCFSTPIFAQFTVSVFIICVTAYQLAFENISFFRILSIVFYLTVMMMQVFIYCHEGNQLVIDYGAYLIARLNRRHTGSFLECPTSEDRIEISNPLNFRNLTIAKNLHEKSNGIVLRIAKHIESIYSGSWSEGVSSAAYESSWYTCSVSTRRSLLVLMSRTRRPARLTAGGITELSLATFMAIIKASYTFLTVLQQVEES